MINNTKHNEKIYKIVICFYNSDKDIQQIKKETPVFSQYVKKAIANELNVLQSGTKELDNKYGIEMSLKPKGKERHLYTLRLYDKDKELIEAIKQIKREYPLFSVSVFCKQAIRHYHEHK